MIIDSVRVRETWQLGRRLDVGYEGVVVPMIFLLHCIRFDKVCVEQDNNGDNNTAFLAPLDWYMMQQKEMGEERTWIVVRFTDWLCRINPMLDATLPACWVSHAWPVMIMDSLYMSYQSAYVLADENPRRPAEWIGQVDTSINQIRAWNNATNHHGNSTCPGTDEEYSRTRINRRKKEEEQGYLIDHNFVWSENSYNQQALVDELMTQPILENVDTEEERN